MTEPDTSDRWIRLKFLLIGGCSIEVFRNGRWTTHDHKWYGQSFIDTDNHLQSLLMADESWVLQPDADGRELLSE